MIRQNFPTPGILERYELIERHPIADLNSEGFLLRHRQTGARVALLANDDDNKVFYIGFRTPPQDSTGVAHIIEHTVLCGSQDFPVKDPFVELAKGSLNTFLNAMTYPDKTVYPVASCNDADFRNLMHVYLDAVFHPNIYQTEKIFRQEGWHYELEDADAPLKLNGVVYNEMKGAFSSPDDVLDREVLNSLYPDTTYAIESGGDPDVIPELTYEQYLEFHRRFYHPSNSYIYLYGNMDMAERLQYLDEAYLSKFTRIAPDSAVELQTPFTAPKEFHKEYPILEGESTEENTYLTYNVCVGTEIDPMRYIAFDVLDYALCSAPGAVLKKALIDRGIGRDIYSTYESGIRQPFFSIVAKNADAAQKEEFLATIRDVLTEQATRGIDKNALYAALNQDEFKYREADYGRMPKGLIYGLQMLDSWLYDDAKPWIHIEAGDTYAALKKAVESSYFEDLIREALLDNPHRTVLLLHPVRGLTEKKEAALAERLAAYKEKLSPGEIQTIVRETRELKEYQETPDTPEALATIPMLSRKDMRRAAEPFVNRERDAGGVRILHHDIFTNGIGYVNFIFDMERVPQELYPYAGLLKTMLGMVDTAHYNYADLYNQINIHTGGISGGVSTYTNQDDPTRYVKTFEINVKVLQSELHWAFDLVREILTTSDFDNKKRLKEILDEQKSQMQTQLQTAGHSAAAIRALSRVSETAKISDMMNGIGAYRLVEQLAALYRDRTHKKLLDRLTRLSKVLFRRENLLIDYTAPEADYAAIEPLAREFADALYTEPVVEGSFAPVIEAKNEAFQTAGQVQFVCRAGNFYGKPRGGDATEATTEACHTGGESISQGGADGACGRGDATPGEADGNVAGRENTVPDKAAGGSAPQERLKYTGALRVLKVIMGYDYLWSNIRVKGGAYGCMSAYAKNGDAFFVTYRDPHLRRSIDVFEKASEYIRGFDGGEREITQFIIGAVSELDTPKSPSGKGAYALAAYLCGATYEQVQKDRDELLDVTAEKIRALADYIDAFLEDRCLCVIGAAGKLEEESRLFDSVEQLIR